MSKIYEALLRAEIDRLAAAREQGESTTQPPAPALPAAQATGNGHHVVARPPEAQWPVPVAPSLASPSPHGDVPFLDLMQVKHVAWNPSPIELPALLQRGGPVEQFRGLRSRVHEFRDLNKLRSVMISSGLAAEGKSFIAANLAISLARYKSSRVLLIDADMRRGSAHRMLGTRNEPGLTEYLAGAAPLAQVMQFPQPGSTGILPRGLSTLAFIPSGADASNAADLAGNGRFEQMLEAMYPLFDWIIIDSSPVNLVSDSINLARSCDGVLLVTRSGVTRFETAQRALTQLKASNVIGVVLNAVEKPPASGGYYGYEAYEKDTEEEG